MVNTSPQSAPPDDLSTLFPIPTIVPAGGEEIEVSPLRLGEIGALSALLAGDGLTVLTNPAEALIDRPETVSRILAVLVRRPSDWLQSLPLNEAADLFRVALEVNADFFTRSGPALIGAVRAMQARAGG